jgi:sugar phosphate isomerase/epimerase
LRHVHAKDTTLPVPPPADAAAWKGREIPLGGGDARLPEVLAALKQVGYSGPLVIEREAGGEREKDAATGIRFLRGCLESSL